MKKILSIVGARPNFMKVAPLHHEITKQRAFTHVICHTGQHYDINMSDIFFTDLQIPAPDYHLGISGGSNASQTGRIMVEFEKVITSEEPDILIVVGDVNSTVACSLVAKQAGIQVAHVEAGLRSFDRSMPEEINRIVTDSISDQLFVSEESGLVNLEREGVDVSKVHFVGNVMIDSLTTVLHSHIKSEILQRYGLSFQQYILVTLHRPSNVDSRENLRSIVDYLNVLSRYHPVLFPLHPRTRNRLTEFELINHLSRNITVIEPLGYSEFLTLMKDARIVVTDSGGIQEETTYLGVPCLTLRNNTERPVTVSIGTNYLAGTDMKSVEELTINVLTEAKKKWSNPPLWDGKSSERIINILKTIV